MSSARAHKHLGCQVALAMAGLVSLAGCGDRAGEQAGQFSGPIPAWSVPFTVRGRWDTPRELTWRGDPAGGSVPIAVFDSTIEEALSAWSSAGLVGFRPARAGEAPDLTFSWARGAHGECRAFGGDFSVGHSGPVQHGTFVHFDAGHGWSVDGRTGESLRQVATHEVGHVLGLGHSPDPTSLMYADPHVSAPTDADLAGLHSLYGGGAEGAEDLRLERNADDGASRSVAPALRRMAPENRTDFAVFDTDGNGADDVIVWRTDPEGIGALTVYHFGEGLVLTRTIGPLLGVVPDGASPTFHVGADGRRWIVSRVPDGPARVRRFDDRGWLRTPSAEELVDVPSSGGVTAARASRPGDPAVARGDLDGDDRVELVLRGGLAASGG